MADLNPLRDRMDEITVEMVRMLKERADLAREISEAKRASGMGVVDEAREDDLRVKVASVSGRIGLDALASSRFLNFLLNESLRVQRDGRQTHLSVFRRAKSLEGEGRKMIHMEVGEPDFAPPGEAGDALCRASGKGLVRYGQAGGMPALRDALAARASRASGAEVSRENVLVAPGARFSVFSAVMTLLGPGDEVIVIEPAWPAYRDCAMYAGAKVRTVATTLEGGWEPSADRIRGMVNPNTRMIVLNYPNNPTGKILPGALQDEIVGIARENGLYVLSDEIYSDYAYADWKSVLAYGYDRSIVAQSFSKSHAMTGFRIGCAIASEDIVGRMEGLAALCLTSVAEPIQYAALRALEADTSGNTATVRRRLDALEARAGEMGLEFARPEGAMYLFAGVGRDGARLADGLLDRGLAVAPGEGFGNYRNFIRISACQDENVLMQGMDILNGMLGDAG